MICTCNGDEDSVYKYYNGNNKTYSCCMNPNFPILTDSYTSNSSYLEAVIALDSDTDNCKPFYQYVLTLTDPQISATFPALYQVLDSRRQLNNIFYEGGEVDFTDPPAIPTPAAPGIASGTSGAIATCQTDYYPVIISFEEDAIGDKRIETYGCAKIDGSIPDSSTLDFQVFYFKDKDGLNCKTSSCTLADDYYSPNVIGDLVKDNGKGNEHMKNMKVWLGIGGFAVLVIIFLVVYFMRRQSPEERLVYGEYGNPHVFPAPPKDMPREMTHRPQRRVTGNVRDPITKYRFTQPLPPDQSVFIDNDEQYTSNRRRMYDPIGAD